MNDIERIGAEALAYPTRAQAYAVKDETDLARAKDFLKEIRLMKAKVENAFADGVKKAHDLHKSLLARMKEYSYPLDEAERIIKGTIAPYLAEQDRKRREEEEKLRELERDRMILADALARSGEQEEKAMASGDVEKWNEVQDRTDELKAEIEVAAKVIGRIIVPEKRKSDGLQIRKIWKFSVEDLNLLPREYMIPDTEAIQAVVLRDKAATSIPGVRAFQEDIVAAKF